MHGYGHGFGKHAGSGMRIRFIGPFLLLALYKAPSYGYELMDKLKEFGFESYMPDQTAIYKMLKNMEEKGYISSRWDTQGSGPARHVYEITSEGIEVLKSLAYEIKDNMQIYGKFLDTFEQLSHGRESEK